MQTARAPNGGRNGTMRANRRRTGNRSRVNRAGVGAAAPLQQVTRHLHRMAVTGLNAQNANGGTENFFSYSVSLDDFAASLQLADQYEQYKITNVRYWVRPNAQNLAGLTDPVDRIGAAFALKNFSTAETFIDYDTQVAPNQSEIYRRDKVNVVKLDHDGWKQIANFTPKVRFDTTTNALPALVSSNDWLSTRYPELNHLGIRGVFKQDSDFWGTSITDCARMSIYITATVQFRGLKSGI